MQKSWNPTVEGTCLPFGATNYVLVAWTILCDVVIIFLPIPLLLKLNVKPAQKAGLLCLFLLGLFTTVCSILRLTQISVIAYGDGNSTMLVLWGTIEFNVGVSHRFINQPTLNSPFIALKPFGPSGCDSPPIDGLRMPSEGKEA